MDWQPISREALDELIAEELAEATPEERMLFVRAAVTPTKWQLSPWGDIGGGFWVVAVLEDRVLWYNDIETVLTSLDSPRLARSRPRSIGATRTNYDGHYRPSRGVRR